MNSNRRIIICPWHWSPAYPRSWTEFNFAVKLAVLGDKNILCEHHLRTQTTLVGRFDLYFQVAWWLDVKTIFVTERYALGRSFDDKLIARINRYLIGFRLWIFRAVLSTLTMLRYAWLLAIVSGGGVKSSVKYSREFESNHFWRYSE